MNTQIKNFHVLTVKFLGPTNNTGARVKIISERFKDSVTIPFDYQFDNTCSIAEAWLTKHGYNITGHAEGKDHYYIITDTFESLFDMKVNKLPVLS
jgi:hypothetical protein